MPGGGYELVSACISRTEAQDPVELELQVVVKSLMWVLGLELGRLQENALLFAESSLQLPENTIVYQ